MSRAPQKRTLETRAKLIAAAQELIAASSYGDLRVEEVVLKAGVAKGTFFAHFRDKDALMDQLIGTELDAIMDQMQAAPAPKTAGETAKALMPMMNFMTSERYVFDVILRHSGVTEIAEIGPIANTFGRQIDIFAAWALAPGHAFRTDIEPDLIAEGIQAFALQAMAAKFCALHNAVTVEERMVPYLDAWLSVPTASRL